MVKMWEWMDFWSFVFSGWVFHLGGRCPASVADIQAFVNTLLRQNRLTNSAISIKCKYYVGFLQLTSLVVRFMCAFGSGWGGEGQTYRKM